MADGWHDIAAAGDIPVGGMFAAEVNGRAVVACHAIEGWFAVDDKCTHAEARLSEGWLRGCRLVCPLHGAAFDVRDGRVLGPPAFHWLATHRIRVVAGRVEIALVESR